MSLSARAIAALGIGYGAPQVAALGLLDVAQTSSAGVRARQMRRAREFFDEQTTLDEKRKAKQAAKAAFEAREREKATETAISQALKSARETAAARLRQREPADAKSGFEALKTAELVETQAASQTDMAHLGHATTEAPKEADARRSGRNRRAAILAALLLLDD